MSAVVCRMPFTRIAIVELHVRADSVYVAGI
jgi:hypothetical protein